MNAALRIHCNTVGVLAASVLASAWLAGCGHPSASAAPERGAQVYAAHCEVCHGQHGEGGSAPGLTGEHYHKNEQQIVFWIKNALLPMPRLYPAALSEQDVEDVATFVASL
jgi:mono/diheme cytochrome c family protein